MSRLKASLLGAVIGATALVGITPANATFYVYYSTDSGGSYTAMPGSPAADGTAISASNQSAGGLTSLSSTFTNNAPNAGATVPSFTNSTQINASSVNGGMITFAIVENNFQGPTAAPLLLTNAITLIPNAGVPNSTLTQTSCVLGGSATVTAANVGSLCGTSLAITAPASVTTTGIGSLSTQTSAVVTSITAPFTTVEYFTLKLAAGANVLAQGSATLSPIPEPISISLLGAGLIGLGVVRNRSRKA